MEVQCDCVRGGGGGAAVLRRRGGAVLEVRREGARSQQARAEAPAGPLSSREPVWVRCMAAAAVRCPRAIFARRSMLVGKNNFLLFAKVYSFKYKYRQHELRPSHLFL
ncbi:uncharacterized protein A4U43_C09F3950 [Asparagus officinalis]|uniref:Uncharacterized protein n=1 Tax=Asparagus officinalis TaxID=4686 RepID=A0A5P1E553_ASPOF|nr:uncharacterized protein A4U43_C09F3950 [Asparagus officinalis]